MFYVFYGKVIEDKQEGIKITYPFLGGETDTKENADILARELVNDRSNQATIIPKIFIGQSITEVYNAAHKKFEKMAENMMECEAMIERRNRKFT